VRTYDGISCSLARHRQGVAAINNRCDRREFRERPARIFSAMSSFICHREIAPSAYRGCVGVRGVGPSSSRRSPQRVRSRLGTSLLLAGDSVWQQRDRGVEREAGSRLQRHRLAGQAAVAGVCAPLLSEFGADVLSIASRDGFSHYGRAHPSRQSAAHSLRQAPLAAPIRSEQSHPAWQAM
jgi:hypothetical protein